MRTSIRQNLTGRLQITRNENAKRSALRTRSLVYVPDDPQVVVLLANGIVEQSATNNPHIAEERNQIVDDSGANEEDKFVSYDF